MKRTHDVTVTTGYYIDANGATKGRYQKIGSLLERDDGSLCFKLEALPIGTVSDKDGNEKPFNGWCNCYATDGEQSAPTPRSYAPEGAGAPQAQASSADRIPF